LPAGNIAAGAPTAAVNADAIWDEAVADHVAAGSEGLAQARIKDVAIAAGDAANSISQKLRGATDNQVFASTAGNTIAFDNARFTMTASQTVEIIPATGESDVGAIHAEVVVGTGDVVQVSSDSGTNYMNQTGRGDSATGGFAAAGEWRPIEFVGNSTGRYRVVTDATVGTRTLQRMITTWS
jgi:hypothetical protein